MWIAKESLKDNTVRARKMVRRKSRSRESWDPRWKWRLVKDSLRKIVDGNLLTVTRCWNLSTFADKMKVNLKNNVHSVREYERRREEFGKAESIRGWRIHTRRRLKEVSDMYLQMKSSVVSCDWCWPYIGGRLSMGGCQEVNTFTRPLRLWVWSLFLCVRYSGNWRPRSRGSYKKNK